VVKLEVLFSRRYVSPRDGSIGVMVEAKTQASEGLRQPAFGVPSW
jgi:hypothetical protein